MDFHLDDVQRRVLAKQERVKQDAFVSHNQHCLKLYKWDSQQPNSLVNYNPSVYLLLQKTDSSTVKILLMTYNEEVLEDLVVQVEEERGIDDSLVTHICNSLNRQLRLCPGIDCPVDLSTSEYIGRILIEKYGDRIIYRSRTCARIILDSDSVECFECRQLKSDEDFKVKRETLTTSLNTTKESKNFDDNDFIDNSDDSDYREPKVKFNVKDKKHRKIRARAKAEDMNMNSYRCELCEMTFSKEPAFISHLLRSHPGEDRVEKDWHKCPEVTCYKVFRDPEGKNMINHMQKFHQDNANVKAEKEKDNTCSYCHKNFTHSSYLQKHIDAHHEAPVVPCHICGALIKGHKTLNVHIRVVHGNQMYSCPEPGCKVKAKNKDHIKDHFAAIHKNEPRYICSVCGTRYKYRNKWKYCEDKHKGKFLHACHQCDKKFNDKRKYQIHQRVHSGEKPFMCPICSIRMARLDNLNAHTKKTHGVTWREAEKMTQNTIGGTPAVGQQEVGALAKMEPQLPQLMPIPT